MLYRKELPKEPVSQWSRGTLSCSVEPCLECPLAPVQGGLEHQWELSQVLHDSAHWLPGPFREGSFHMYI